MPAVMPRLVFLSIVLTSIVSAAVVIDHRSGSVDAPPPSNPASPTSISAPGVVEGATEEIAIVPEITGVIAKRLVSVGEQVVAGQPLMQLDSREARLCVVASQAELASATAQRERLINGARVYEREEARALREAAHARLRQAETVLARTEQLEHQRAVSEQEADDARSAVDALRAELAAAVARVAQLEAPAREDEVRLADAHIAAAQATLQTAQVALDKTQLRAPSDAQVLDINAEVGELISPVDATPVIVLTDTRRLRVRAYVEELDAPRLQLGAQVTITADGLPGRVFRGTVTSLSPSMSAKDYSTGKPNELYDTRVREVLVDVEEGGGLIVGLRVDVWWGGHLH